MFTIRRQKLEVRSIGLIPMGFEIGIRIEIESKDDSDSDFLY
jgi:hypothetical protein